MKTTEKVSPSANGSAAPPVPQPGERLLNGGADAQDLGELLHALQAMRVGDFTARMAGDRVGLLGKIADTFNEIVAANERMASELAHVGQVVGREGKTRTRVKFGLQSGSWAAMEASVESRKVDPSMAPARRLRPGLRNAAAPQAQAAAASIAPSSEGIR